MKHDESTTNKNPCVWAKMVAREGNYDLKFFYKETRKMKTEWIKNSTQGSGKEIKHKQNEKQEEANKDKSRN
jgi:hypothetical protein